MFCYLIFLWTYQGFYLSRAEQPSPKSIIDRGRRVAGHRTSCVLLQSGTHWPPCDDLDTRPRCLEATCPLVFTLLYSAGLILVIYHVVGIYPKVCLGEKGLSCKAETDGGGVGGVGAQTVKHVVEQKYCSFFFSLQQKKMWSRFVSFCLMPDWRLLCAAAATVSEYLRGHECATCRSAIDCMKRVTVCACVCVFVCAHARVVVTEKWCACSDCILWPSALNK